MPANAVMEKDLRRRIALEAAKLLHSRQETDYVRAKRRAARLLGVRFRHLQLPATREIRDQLHRLEQLYAEACPLIEAPALRREALAVMREMRRLPARLAPLDAGSLSPSITIQLPKLLEQDAAVALQKARPNATIERTVRGSEVALRLDGAIPIEVRLSATPDSNGLSLDDLEALIVEDRPEANLDHEELGLDSNADRFETCRTLLAQLEEVRQDPITHPEGDALFHSLQVFELALAERPFDEEFLTAALLHDVGKATLDPDHVAASLELLEGLVTRRTRWLIGEHHAARAYLSGELSPEDRTRLERSPDFGDVLLLAELDARGRVPGAAVRTLDEALELLRAMDAEDTFDE